MLGVYTRYCRCEAAYLATRIAHWASLRAIPITFKSTSSTSRIGLLFDEDVQKNARTRFTDLVKKCEMVLWTHVPPPEQIAWVNKQGVKTIITSMWDEFKQQQHKSMLLADCVLCPAIERVSSIKRRWPDVNPIFCPWDNGQPQTSRSMRQATYRVLLMPMFDREVLRMEMTDVDIIGRTLERFEDCKAVFCYNSSIVASYAKRRIKDMRKRYGNDRVQELKSVTPTDRYFVYMQSDLTIWPVQTISTGMVGVDSITSGTPVLAYSYPPLTEFLTKRNSVLTTCNGYIDTLHGVTKLRPSCNNYEQQLWGLLENPNRLQNLQATVSIGLANRRRSFDGALTRVLET